MSFCKISECAKHNNVGVVLWPNLASDNSGIYQQIWICNPIPYQLHKTIRISFASHVAMNWQNIPLNAFFVICVVSKSFKTFVDVWHNTRRTKNAEKETSIFQSRPNRQIERHFFWTQCLAPKCAKKYKQKKGFESNVPARKIHLWSKMIMFLAHWYLPELSTSMSDKVFWHFIFFTTNSFVFF